MDRRTFALAVAFTATGLFHAAAQTVREDLRSGDAHVFDTIEPSSYRLDFPQLPPEDPFSALSRGEPFSLSILSDSQALFDTISNFGLPSPSESPADYNPEEVFIQGNILNEQAPQAAISYPVSNAREIILLDRGHPVFYEIGKTASLFYMQESANSLILPDIPDPSLVFEKQRARLNQIGPVRYAIDLFQSYAYNNNVFAKSSDLEGDSFYSLNPRLYLETGTRGFAAFSYAPSFVFYQKYNEMNATNENLNFTLRYPFTKLAIGTDFSFLTQSGIFINSNGFARSRSYLSNSFASYPLSAKTTARVSYLVSWNDMSPGSLRTDHVGTLSIDHAFSPIFTLGGYLEGGETTAPAGRQPYSTIGLKFSYRPSYHLRLEGQLGHQYRKLPAPLPSRDFGQLPVFKITGAYHYNANLGVILRAYREIGADAFNNVSLQSLIGGDIGFMMRIHTKTDLNLRVGGGYIEQWSTEKPLYGTLSYLESSFSLSHALTRNIELVLFDNLQRRFTATNSNPYTANTVGVALRLRY